MTKETVAVTLYPFIFYNGKPTADTKRHEWVHIEQVKKKGWIRFYLTYLWYNIKYGYDKNPFEKEAYKK